MRESWSDKRLDDLNAKVDRGFERLDADLRLQRVETRTEFTALRGEMKSGFERMDERFDERFDALHGLLLRGAGVVVTALVGLVATQL